MTPDLNHPAPPAGTTEAPDAVLDGVLRHLDAALEPATARLVEFLRIPSVSAQRDHDDDCARAAEWARGQLAAIGFAAAVHPTAGQPIVLARHDGPGDKGLGDGPHVLFYGHYDVQPAEPLAPWTSPPFEPAVVDGPHGRRVVARGAVDDKGQSLMWLEALRAWHEVAGSPPVRVTVLLEGEEEVGSPNLEAFLSEHRDALAADVAVISDTGMWDIDTPAITTRLRGLAYTQLTVRGPARDLHSGMYGGSAPNPITALAHILARLHDADGRVAIPGFHDGVAEPSPAQLEEWRTLGFDEAAFLGGIGVAAPASPPSAERGRGGLERLWARPTAEVNGIWGGYQGPGSKTVIPAEAGAKVSFRLVPGQDPDRIVALFRDFAAAHAPPGTTTTLEAYSGSPGFEVASGSRWVAAARGALSAEFGRPAVLIGSGGSIPVVEQLRRVLGIDSLLVGFGLEDDQVHGPDEKFELRCLHAGMRSHARLLAALAKQG
ncbi:MAG: dipeptidase [Janthinobacterium lividum]